MDALNLWWDALDGAMKFFYVIAFASTFVLLLQTALMFFGGDVDGMDADVGEVGDIGDVDAGGDLDHGGDHDVSVLSVRSITAFLVGLGWMGAILTDIGWSLLVVLPLAMVMGFLLMMLVWWFMKLLHSLGEKGNLDYVYAIGETGQVYLPIPPNREKAGKVEVMIQGRLKVVDAFTDDTEKIPNRKKVRVLDIVGEDTLVVEAVE